MRSPARYNLASGAGRAEYPRTARTAPVATPEGDAFLRNLMTQAFDTEDKPVIEAAYANLDGDEFWAQKPVFLGVDAGGARARRLLEMMIARETSPAS